MLEILANSYVVLGISAIAAIVMMISLEVEREGVATTAVSIALALLLWNYGHDLWSFVKSDYVTTLLFVLGYLVVGVVWSFLKWNEKVKKVFAEFRRVKDKYVTKNGKIETKEELKDFSSYLVDKTSWRSGSFYDKKTMAEVVDVITPKGIENKSTIVAWISYWPLSLLATLLNNPFRRLFEYVYSLVSGLYDRISKKHASALID
jgi:Ca2+/Na+ antiporter